MIFVASYPPSLANAQPMSILASVINALAVFYPDVADIVDPDQLEQSVQIIMAQARTVVSSIFRRRHDEPMIFLDVVRGMSMIFSHVFRCVVRAI
ncbi:citrate (Si)-synthase [Bifidobacterium bohemicum DSM 22767]|uniref:Citrate (Si)-synthase n=1 Tax=Bifidobacterium bohemicum DSM 22767 TaxID=1437606 RepID=A0A086ZK67_9BIFI|nr:citrate (Si)-synthase [Bifidobacterium bohemicum DSM 22767]